MICQEQEGCMTEEYGSCHLCPRNCGVDRNITKGACGVGSTLQASRASLHFWEEPCISGKRGSGTIFFSGCSLKCVYCQNHEISHGSSGKEISLERLVEMFFELEEQGADNINLVTADHFLPTVAAAIERAKLQGIGIPFLLNTSSYVNVGTLKRLEGLIDIYLPDMKYIRNADAMRYSRAPGYPDIAKAAIEEMVRQQPECIFIKEMLWRQDNATGTEPERNTCTPGMEKEKNTEDSNDETIWLLKRGVVVRHLLLPGQLIQAKIIVNYLHKTYGDSIYISLLSQYTPEHKVLAGDHPEINRKVTQYEYRSLVRYASQIGVTKGFVQGDGAADEDFIPEFDGRGV